MNNIIFNNFLKMKISHTIYNSFLTAIVLICVGVYFIIRLVIQLEITQVECSTIVQYSHTTPGYYYNLKYQDQTSFQSCFAQNGNLERCSEYKDSFVKCYTYTKTYDGGIPFLDHYSAMCYYFHICGILEIYGIVVTGIVTLYCMLILFYILQNCRGKKSDYVELDEF